MRVIPEALKRRIAADPWYRKCCLCHSLDVQWHHNLIYAGQQVNEVFCILPVCETHHEGPEGPKRNALTRQRLDELMYKRATSKERKDYELKEPTRAKQKASKYSKCSICGAENVLMICCGKYKK